MLNIKVQGKQPQGRPWERWINQVKKNLQERRYNWEELKTRKAWEDRDKWRHVSNQPSKKRILMMTMMMMVMCTP